MLQALLDRNPVATETFVRAHSGWMLALSRRIVADAGLAEDVVQTAFGKIFEKLETFDGRATLKTWMYRIVVNEALMLTRRRSRQAELPIDPLLPQFDANGCRLGPDLGDTKTPEYLLQQSQTADTVKALIGQLPEKYRITLLLRDIEGLPTDEVATILDISEANVKVRLHRARAALKKLIEPLIEENQL